MQTQAKTRSLPLVETTSGPVVGRIETGVAVFKGIPYGGSVSGDRRWLPAAAPEPWSEPLAAFAYGPAAAQVSFQSLYLVPPDVEALLLADMPSDDGWRTTSEDCLTLNIWTPAPFDGSARPVMLWCHGGGYFAEVPPIWWVDGEELARAGDVVVITFRHRLGALGFLHLADFPGGEGHAHSGNISLLDIVLALQWVRENIAAFGGDPGNVTIFGQSGGAEKVCALLAMPTARGLFHKAIMQSGNGMNCLPREEGTETAKALCSELGIAEDIDALKAVSIEALLAGQQRVLARSRRPWEQSGLTGFHPVINGIDILQQPFAPEPPSVSADVLLMIGTCRDEANLFTDMIIGAAPTDDATLRQAVGTLVGDRAHALIAEYRKRRPDVEPQALFRIISTDYIARNNAILLAERKAAQGSAPVYMYMLAYPTNALGGRLACPHILDLPFIFGRPSMRFAGTGPGREAVSRQMLQAWAAFARTGSPEHDGLPEWNSFTRERRSTMIFDVVPELVDDPAGNERRAWSDADEA